MTHKLGVYFLRDVFRIHVYLNVFFGVEGL